MTTTPTKRYLIAQLKRTAKQLIKNHGLTSDEVANVINTKPAPKQKGLRSPFTYRELEESPPQETRLPSTHTKQNTAIVALGNDDGNYKRKRELSDRQKQSRFVLDPKKPTR